MIFKHKTTGARVEILTDSVIRFAPQGGGFSLSQPAVGFLAEYEAEGVKAPMRRALFTIDASPWAVEGYHQGDRWNGWARPHFTRLQATVLASLMGYLECDIKTDTWRATFDGADPEYEFWKGEEIEVDGKTLHVYAIGAGSWTWDVTEYKNG